MTVAVAGGATRHLPVADRQQVRRAARALIGADRLSFSGMLVVNCLAAAAGLASPWLLGRIVDDVQRHSGSGAVTRLALAVVVFAVAQLLLVRYGTYLGSRFGERIQARVREQYVDRVLTLPPAVVERAGTGDLAARGTVDVTLIGNTLRDAAPAMLIAALQVLFIVVVVLIVDPLLGLCGVVGVAGIQLAARWYLKRARDDYLAQGAAGSVLAEQLAATVGGARTIEALSLQDARMRACDDAVVASRRTQHRTLFLRSVLYPSVDVSCVLPVVLVLLLGLTLTRHDVLSIGSVVAAALYMQQLAQPVATMLQWIEQVQNSGASFARVEGVVEVARDPDETATGLVPVGDLIEARGVCYAYEDARDVVSDVTLTIRPGERLAVVGPSGAGKTTLARLLAGGDRPRLGTLTVGDAPIADLPPDRLREHVQFVTQEQHVFLGTIADNLRLAAPDATDDELRAALRVVGAEWCDELAAGIDTELGGRDHGLDPGQVQQIALARVVLADPHTLVLDEATALLDPRAARQTERALATFFAERTIVTVAHRLQTARDADRVAIMQHGRIAELGTHEELLERGGAYATLWRSWAGDADA